jgi:GR25 family glycosyltransferase involved in LPS biosynthesis
MKNYIIYLSEFKKSIETATEALKTAQRLGWQIELFSGINGLTVEDDKIWNNWNININQSNKKCVKMMNKPGVRGCFLSHWILWKMCAELNEPIGIFEHDILFLKPPLKKNNIRDLLRLEGFEKQKPNAAGEWYEGARAYIITPVGARKLIDWVVINGALPADVLLGKNILDIELDDNNLVKVRKEHKTRLDRHTDSFTWNLKGMDI